MPSTNLHVLSFLVTLSDKLLSLANLVPACTSTLWVSALSGKADQPGVRRDQGGSLPGSVWLCIDCWP